MNPPEECNFPPEDSIFISPAKRDYSITQQRVYNELFLHFIQSKTLNLHYNSNLNSFNTITSLSFFTNFFIPSLKNSFRLNEPALSNYLYSIINRDFNYPC